LLGHSFGGHVVFEMAQQLQRQGQSIALVSILDKDAPALKFEQQNNLVDLNNSQLINKIGRIIEDQLGKNLQIDPNILNSLTEEKQANYFKQQLEQVGFLPVNTDIKLVNALLEVCRVQIQINYIPENILLTPISLFQTESTFQHFQQQDSSELSKNSALGWSHFADGKVEIETVPGSHVSMLREPYVKILAEKLQQSIWQCCRKLK